jgi:hypothetical protein
MCDTGVGLSAGMPRIPTRSHAPVAPIAAARRDSVCSTDAHQAIDNVVELANDVFTPR